MNCYEPSKIEPKWQKKWEESDLYQSEDFSKKPKKYILVEFPYPSGAGLHVGHIRSYTALDIVSRKLRMQGYNVMYPMGWDAFGLPTENYAIKNKIHPRVATEQNITTFKKQIKSLGLSFDWLREVDTTDPKYYKWTQWIFLQLFKKGLAYKKKMPINWCPSCKIGLANEEVIDDKCERCGALTEKKEKEQWMLAITKYADRLIDDLDTVDYLEKIKTQQINWIGRSEGVIIKFKYQISNIKNTNQKSKLEDFKNNFIEVFTTRADTLFGCTYVVLAPEHEIVQNQESRIKNQEEVKKYIDQAKQKADFERAGMQKDKTGVELKGIKAINPINNEEVSVWVADYVLASYGTGAVMAVPAHDSRDWEFAEKFGLPKMGVIQPSENQKSKIKNQNYNLRLKNKDRVILYEEDGVLINSGEFNGLSSESAREKITQKLEKDGAGKRAVNYKLRDWVFSRQHYWGEPIPLVFCLACKKQAKELRIKNQELGSVNNNFNNDEWLNAGWIPVLEKDLPVELPDVKNYEPTDTGESPLANIGEWVNVKCPQCGGQAKRETDTMPNWAGSSWYFLRYIDAKNDNQLASPEKLKYWLTTCPASQKKCDKGGGVDLYNGGMEHTTLHLLYSRFWNKFLFDIGVSPVSEPYARRVSHGMVLAEDGKKMSKSLGNVINPDDIVSQFGADSLRLYEMFMGPFDQTIPWSADGAKGVKRFLERVYAMRNKIVDDNSLSIESREKLQKIFHKTIKKVGDDIDEMKFNTAVAQFMILVNQINETKEITAEYFKLLLIILAPFAPHLAEELWEKGGNKESVFREAWPKYDEKFIKDEIIKLIVQINGKMRDAIETPFDISQQEAEKIVLESEKTKQWIGGKQIKKIIFVKNKLINFVVE